MPIISRHRHHRGDWENTPEQQFRSALLLALALPATECPERLQANHDGGRAGFLRAALEWRAELESFEYLHWEHSPDPALLHFSRPYGWHCVTNISTARAPVPEGIIVISSSPIRDGCLPAGATVWLLRWVE
jgi:hypothetical protein